MHLKESYQRSFLIVTEFTENDVIVTSGTASSDPTNGTNNGLDIGVFDPNGGTPTLNMHNWY